MTTLQSLRFKAKSLRILMVSQPWDKHSFKSCKCCCMEWFNMTTDQGNKMAKACSQIWQEICWQELEKKEFSSFVSYAMRSPEPVSSEYVQQRPWFITSSDCSTQIRLIRTFALFSSHSICTNQLGSTQRRLIRNFFSLLFPFHLQQLSGQHHTCYCKSHKVPPTLGQHLQLLADWTAKNFPIYRQSFVGVSR